MSWDDSLTDLLDLLVRHYPDPAGAREVAEKAGLSTRSISLADDIENVWMSVLREARRSATGLRDIARVARMDYPNIDFLALVRQIDEGADDAFRSHEPDAAVGRGSGLEPSTEADRLADLHQGIVHPLPAAPLFVGRVQDLDVLRGFWHGRSDCNVLALIGLGGAGKTAIASEFVSRLLDPAAEADRPDGLFVWSFYVDQDVSNFLRHAYRYFSRGLKPDASGTGLLYRLTEWLVGGGRNLIVLDGLERVQRPPGDLKWGFGELEDPLLRQAITRLASGAGRTKCLITTRFPVPDLHRWEGREYTRLEVDRLDRVAARQLLRQHGVRGDDRALDTVVDEYGSHALTLDHIGAYLADFCDGEPAAAGRLEEPQLDSDTPEERKLARVLRAYEKALSPREVDLLVRFCIFRTGASSEALHAVFSRTDAPGVCGDLAGCTEEEFRRMASRLARLHLLLPEPGGGHTAHPAIRDHFYRIFTDAAAAHRIVGEKLRSDCGLELAAEWERVAGHQRGLMAAQDGFQHRCSKARLKIETYRYSQLSGRLRAFLSRWGQRLSPECAGRIRGYIESLEDGIEYFQLPDLESTNRQLYYNSKNSIADGLLPSRGGREQGPKASRGEREQGPEELHEEWELLEEYKHVLDARKRMTDRLREILSRQGQRLSRECAGRIQGCIQSLEDGDDDFRLPDLELNSSGLTLRFRPGSVKPEDPALLDALEEVIYHTVRSGNEKEAYRLYSGRMGGREHLGKVIGEFARGVRILRYFRACPNELDLAWYLRGVGDLRASFDLLAKTRPIWSRAVLCLQGFLPRVVRDKVGWEHSRVIAAFLMGRPDALDPRFDLGWGEALVNADVPLMKGELARARAVATSDLKGSSQYVPEKVRTRLVLAEIERREGRTAMALTALEREAPWIMRSGSVEHLCLYHLIRSRVLTDQGEYEAADSESREGLILARQCGLGLAHVDFLNLRCRLALTRARTIADRSAPQREAFLEAAARSALGALNGIRTEDGDPAPQPDLPLGDLVAFGAQHPECQYAWGAADGLALLGEVLTEQGHPSLARGALRQARDIQSAVRHPDLARTEALLSRLS
jgi:hypothetical protein